MSRWTTYPCDQNAPVEDMPQSLTYPCGWYAPVKNISCWWHALVDDIPWRTTCPSGWYATVEDMLQWNTYPDGRHELVDYGPNIPICSCLILYGPQWPQIILYNPLMFQWTMCPGGQHALLDDILSWTKWPSGKHDLVDNMPNKTTFPGEWHAPVDNIQIFLFVCVWSCMVPNSLNRACCLLGHFVYWGPPKHTWFWLLWFWCASIERILNCMNKV